MDSDLQFNWSAVFDKAIATCNEDDNYAGYSAREKMLAFMYTFLQIISEDENKFTSFLKQQRIPFIKNPGLEELRKLFSGYCDTLILEGTNSGEIQARPFVANYYGGLLWNTFLSVLYYWANDKSENKEHTDVLVEKSVHFTFDILAPGVIDSGLDLIQNIFKLRK
ncbi:MAG: TetR/AcrR family transcriptional regulator [Bacteroidota bacterium]|nr:TetR/AcrR family transcriptional regulator [Bacteroidota bacterium]